MMILRNPYFQAAVAVSIAQQTALAVSTYFIALAGESLVARQPEETRRFIALFFGCALVAYGLGSVVTFLTARLKNREWNDYVLQTYESIKFKQSLSSRTNQQRTTGWLGGEAFSTIDQASDFAVGTISIYCNVAFTFIVFALTLGIGITLSLASAVLVSIILVRVLKRKIQRLAADSQTTKLDTLMWIDRLWDQHLHADSSIAAQGRVRFLENIRRYSSQIERYVLTEQFVACLPIYITLPILLAAMYETGDAVNANPAVMGAIVAVLPRSLQLLGDIHSLSISNSKIFFFVEKLRNLAGFVATLEVRDLQDAVAWDRIRVVALPSGQAHDARGFYRQVVDGSIVRGRFRLTGTNGSGKTSLLKLIKQAKHEALYCAQDTWLIDHDDRYSAGQRQIRQIGDVFSRPSLSIVLLDEWDANLDSANTDRLDQAIAAGSKDALVIEVRHLSRAA